MTQYRYQLERYRESPTQRHHNLAGILLYTHERHSERTKRAWESPPVTHEIATLDYVLLAMTLTLSLRPRMATHPA